MAHWKRILNAAVRAFPYSMVALAVVFVFASASALGTFDIWSLLYCVLLGVMFLLASPLAVPFLVVIVPWVLLIPALAFIACFAAIWWMQAPQKSMIAIWFTAWTALFAAALSTGKISV